MKSDKSLPAVKESPAPCTSATRTSSLLSARSSSPARAAYIATVIAFFLDGRLNWTRKTLPESSVMISSIKRYSGISA